MKTFSYEYGGIIVTAQDVDTDSVLYMLQSIESYLRSNPIPSPESAAKIIQQYLDEHGIGGVTSVNGQTGAVSVTAESIGAAKASDLAGKYGGDNPPPYPVTSVNGQTGAVTVETSDPNAYSPSNPPPYPVTSVNGKTGAVTIETSDPHPDAYTPSNPPPYPVTSVNGQSGNVVVNVPVTSVNGQTGNVVISTSDPNSYSPSNPPPYPVTSVNGQTGDVNLSFAQSVQYSTGTLVNWDSGTGGGTQQWRKYTIPSNTMMVCDRIYTNGDLIAQPSDAIYADVEIRGGDASLMVANTMEYFSDDSLSGSWIFNRTSFALCMRNYSNAPVWSDSSGALRFANYSNHGVDIYVRTTHSTS